MKRSDKEQLVAELKSKLDGAEGVLYTDFTGLNVKRMTELRRRFRKAGVEYVVIKNTLALRAVNEAGLTGQALKGPTGVVVAKDTPNFIANHIGMFGMLRVLEALGTGKYTIEEIDAMTGPAVSAADGLRHRPLDAAAGADCTAR